MIHVSAKFKPVTNSLDMPFADQDLVDRAVGIRSLICQIGVIILLFHG